MSKSIQNLLLWILFILCTIHNKLITTFLVLVVIYFFYFVKLAINSAWNDQSEGSQNWYIKQQTFFTKESQKRHIFENSWTSPKKSKISRIFTFQGSKMILIFLLFFRLLFFQLHLDEDYKKIWCRQNGQEIDVTLFWYVPENNESKILMLKTEHWLFHIKWFLMPDQKEMLSNSSFLTFTWKIQCLWPRTIIPFTRESLMIARWNRGVITKISSLTSKNQLSIPPESFNSSVFSRFNSLVTSHQSLVTDWQTDWILRWILIWDTSSMTPETYQLFLDSWLIHLISASWGNILLLIEIVAALCFFIQIRYRKHLFALIVLLYFILVWDNLSFIRAVMAFLITIFLIPSWHWRSRKTVFFMVLILFAFYNPLIIITSWWLLLSASGVWGLMHIPWCFQKHKIVSIILPSLFAYIALLGPLFLLTQHINLLSIPLSILAQWLTTAIIFVSPLLFSIHLSFIVQFLLDMLYRLAYRWSIYWIFIATDSHSTIIALTVRIISWLSLHIIYTYFHKKYLTSLRD